MKKIALLLVAVLIFSTFPHAYAAEEFSFVNAYETFDSYCTFTSQSETVAISSFSPLNGGEGWDSAWTQDSTFETIEIYEGHKFMSQVEINGPADLHSYDLGDYPLYRKLQSEIDLSFPSEYYIRVNARAQMSDPSKHNIRFYLGDNICFGTKYTDNNIVASLTYPGGSALGINTYKKQVYHTYDLYIKADGNGNNTVKFRVYIKGTPAPDYELEKTFTSTEKISFLKIKDTQWATSRVSDIAIEGYSSAALEAATAKINGLKNGTVTPAVAQASIKDFGSIVYAMFESQLNSILGTKYIFDDFEEYADVKDSSVFPSVSTEWSIKNKTLNGGRGWNGAWYDSSNNTISGNHFLKPNSSKTGLDLNSYDLNSYPLSRKFANPIDFSKKGEYYISINAMPAIGTTSSNFFKHNLTFFIGDKISFGTKSATPDVKKYSAHLTAGRTAYVSEAEYSTNVYYTYLINLVSNGDGSGNVKFKIYRKDSPVPAEYNAQAALTGLTTLDYLKIQDGNSATARVSDINFEYYEADELDKAKNAITAFSNGTASYEDSLAEVEKISGLAKAHLLAELEDSNEYLSVNDFSFSDSEGTDIVNAANVGDSLIYSFTVENNYKSDVNINAVLAVYYDGVLAVAKTLNTWVDEGSVSGELNLGFSGEQGDTVPAGEDTKREVKVYIWEKSSLVPYCDPIYMYSLQNERAVTPSMFGAETDESITVAIIGDSITHMSESYPKWVEYYYRAKYPDKDITFVNNGISGDTCSGVLSRFEWDVLASAPDEATMMIGMNDVNRNLYPDGTEANKQAAIDNCLNNIKEVVRRCKEKNIKLTLITPALYDEDDDYSTQTNCKGVNEALGKIAAGVIKIANENNLAYIDFYGATNYFNNQIRKIDDFASASVFNSTDRVHPNSNGAFAEGFIFISQQINNSIVAKVEIDAKELKVKAENASVTGAAYLDGTLSYTYKPHSLPIARNNAYQKNEEQFRISVTDTVNREIIKITGLAEGNYKILFGEDELGTYTSAELAKGVNIAILENNPGQVQSKELYDLVTKKAQTAYKLRDIAYVERSLVSAGIDISDTQACIDYATLKNYNESSEDRYKNYIENKKAQETTKATLASYDQSARDKAKTKSYEVKLIKQ